MNIARESNQTFGLIPEKAPKMVCLTELYISNVTQVCNECKFNPNSALENAESLK